MRRVLAVVALCAMLGACDDGPTLGNTWSEAELVQAGAALQIGDHAVLQLEAGATHAGDLSGAGFDRVPLKINLADDYEICFDADGELRHELHLISSDNSEVLYSGRAGDDCVTLSLQRGVHQLEIHHALKGDASAAARPLFIVPNRSRPAIQAGGKVFANAPRFDLEADGAAVTASVTLDVDARPGHASLWFARQKFLPVDEPSGEPCPDQPRSTSGWVDDTSLFPPVALGRVDVSGAGFEHESNAPCFVSVGTDTSLVLTQQRLERGAQPVQQRLYHPGLFEYGQYLALGAARYSVGFLAADDQWAGAYAQDNWRWRGTVLSPAVIPSAAADARMFGPGRPVLFTGAGRSGTAFHVSGSLADFRLIPALNDNVESIGMPDNTYVYAFRDVDYFGPVSYLTGSQGNFTDDPAAAQTGPNSWSSLIVRTGLPAGRDTGRSILISNRRCPYCDLAGVDLRNQDLSGVDLSHANLSGARLGFVDLGSAKLSYVDLGAADLTAANLQCADLSHANLLDATLRSGVPEAPPFGELDPPSTPIPVAAYRARFDQAVLPRSGTIEVTPAPTYGGCQDQDAPARTSFVKATLSAIVLAPVQWRHVDLSHANIIDLDQLDLAGVDFSGAILTGLDLSGGAGVERDLRGSQFRNACLLDANLEGAQLSCADDGSCVDLSGANLRGANLNYANLHRADLSGAVLSALQSQSASAACRDVDQSRIHGARADHAFFGDANLANADLSFASFVDSQFSGPALNFDGVILTGADFSDAMMAGVNLARSGGAAPMRGINLDGAVLVDAILSGVDMSPDSSGGGVARDASLTDADLRGAILDNANLTGADMTGAAWAIEAGSFTTQRLASSDSAQGTLETYTRSYAPSSRNGMTTDEQTTCPNGDPGPCTQEAQFRLPAAPMAPDCVPSGNHFCPRRPRPTAR